MRAPSPATSAWAATSTGLAAKSVAAPAKATSLRSCQAPIPLPASVAVMRTATVESVEVVAPASSWSVALGAVASSAIVSETSDVRPAASRRHAVTLLLPSVAVSCHARDAPNGS